MASLGFRWVTHHALNSNRYEKSLSSVLRRVNAVLPLVLYLFIVGLFAVYQAERVAVGANDLPITDLLKGRTGVAMLGWWQ